ncbi:uncharacterized protein [Aegilops tauschii subsp. strangulata]|uniref:uncharacterized protein n=1 Tax=Aegilops tauschii subsp. strangulata TaxID=200361 RepID=UPI003CC87844
MGTTTRSGASSSGSSGASTMSKSTFSRRPNRCTRTRCGGTTTSRWCYGSTPPSPTAVRRHPVARVTAYHLWQQLEIFFRDNAAGRAVHIGAEFHATVQGDMSVAQYCRRLQQLASALADVGEPVTDRSLTLQLVRGLSRRFQTMATLLPMQQPFPTFVQARSRLLLEEINITERERTAGATALAVNHGGPSGDRPPPSSPSDKGKAPASGSPSADRGRRRGRGRGRGHGTPGASSSSNIGRGQPSPQPWMGYFAPWGSPAPSPQQWRSPWVPPNAAGVLGPRPPAPQQAYQVAGPSSSAPQWDQQGMMAHAFANLQLQQPPSSSEWLMDTGATSHIAGSS